ncbi:MAG TPA: deoxyribodipyrimidine photo-lyase, partial [Verrucomicrobiae bacterium]
MKNTVLVWFRIDLRLADNPALQAALRQEAAVIPVYIHAPEEEAAWRPGGASDWWLHQSLAALERDLGELGARLIIRPGPALATLQQLIRETGATGVFWNRRYEPAVIARDAVIKDALRAEGHKADSYNAALLHEPWTVKNKSGNPFQVFTPYWRHCLTLDEPHAPLRAPTSWPTPAKWPKSQALAELGLEPKIAWAGGLAATWKPGSTGAQHALTTFLDRAAAEYSENRNRPDLIGTSRLSPHLHFGEISPRQIWHALKKQGEKNAATAKTWTASQYLAEIGWREFAHHLLFHFPRTPDEPLRRDFEKFPWHHDDRLLRAWEKGLTGYPIVDAGMRELWATGWMHNRVR